MNDLTSPQPLSFVALWLRRVAWLVFAVLAVWAVAWLAVPWVIKDQLQKVATAQLGRAVTVGAVDFKPWSLELTLTDLSVAGRDGTAPQLQIKRIYANAELESLVRLAPVVETLVVEQPRARLVHTGDGKYDIDDILARLAQGGSQEPSEPLRFALFNLSLLGGELDFDDQAVGKKHQLRGLDFAVPFLSNLESRRTVRVDPRLAFVLNGSRFESTAQTTPFAPTRATDVSFSMRDVNLAPYLGYLPDSLPVRLQHAVVGWDLKLAFEQRDRPALKLSGTVRLSDVQVTDTAKHPLLSFGGLDLALEEFRPLDRVVKLASVALQAPRVDIRRDANGRLELPLNAPTSGNTAAAVSQPALAAATPAASATSAAGASAPPKSGEWTVDVAKITVRDGAALWSDASVAGGATLWAHALSLDLAAVTWPMRQPAQVQGSVALSAKEVPATSAAQAASQPAAIVAKVGATPSEAAAHLKFDGEASDQAADIKLTLEDLPVALAEPYLAQFLQPSLRGQLHAAAAVHWKAPDLQLAVESLRADKLELTERSAKGGPSLASIKQVALAQVQVDLVKQSVTLGKLLVNQPTMAITRGRDGRWMFENWQRPSDKEKVVRPSGDNAAKVTATASSKGQTANAPAVATSAPAWNILLKDLVVEGGNITYEDQATPKPVSLVLSALKLQMNNVQPNGTRPEPVKVSASIRSGRGEPGLVDYRGTLQMQPLAAHGDLALTRIPVHAFEPYFGGSLNIELLRADTSFKGNVRYLDTPKGPAVQVNGDTAVEEFRANSLAAADGGLQVAEELLNWKGLALRGFSLDMAPGKAPLVAVKETTLSDFYARLIIHETGRINLQDLVKTADAPAGAAVAAAPAASAASTAATPSATAASVPAAPAASPPNPLDPVITIGPINLINGRVLFSDRFVKPNYSANLSDLTGKLSAFSSVAPQGQPQLADLELRGRAEGTASLEILGKLNPLAQPLALDIKGKVRDLELPPLSTYAIKYAGHGIERGKLSVDVAYQVLPNGQLTASNKLVLNQLTFGNAVDGAPNSLPVKLAVALLADRNGVIDIDLPVSGSLNDPQFRLGPIIFKVIVNLIVKAVTAPFSLLANVLGGGGDELSTVAFAPGSAALTVEAKSGLDKVAKALTDRPALKMTVVGTSDLEREREALKHERLQTLLVAEKRRKLIATGSATAATEAAAALTIGDEERPALIKEVFQRADIAKPRNAVGLTKEIALPDMEALLLANITVTEDAMRELALQRGVVVKDYLGSRQLPVERLFLGAVKPAANDDKWSPHAELSLTTN